MIAFLLYVTSNFVHYFVGKCEFKLELQSGNTQFASKSSIFQPMCDFEIWQMISRPKGHLFYTTKSFVHHSVPICAFKTRVTIQNCTILVQIVHFLACVTLKFHRWLPKPIGHLSYATLKLCAAFRISITSMGCSVTRIAWLNTWSAIILTWD